MLSPQRKSSLPTTAEALPGRETAICISDKHLQIKILPKYWTVIYFQVPKEVPVVLEGAL
jgi:hypothetical protein